jgi:hypothetical protein
LADEDFNAPLARIQAFNKIKTTLLRMTRSNGYISLGLLEGILRDLRNKMNIEILRYDFSDPATDESQGDFRFADNSKLIGQTAQIVLNYATQDVRLPR